MLVGTIHEIKCRPIFKEEQYSCSLKQLSSNFCRYSCQWKQLFPASGNRVFIKSFITTSVYGFWVDFKLCAFSESFFSCCWKTLSKLSVNQFSSFFFQFLTVEAVFSCSENGFSIECYSIRQVETDFFSSVLLWRANFGLIETIIQIKVSHFLIE